MFAIKYFLMYIVGYLCALVYTRQDSTVSFITVLMSSIKLLGLDFEGEIALLTQGLWLN